jgi:hypothetical protein
LNVHNILDIPPLLYGCEMRALKQRILKRLKTAEMKFMRRIAGYSLLENRRKKYFRRT